MTCIAAIAQEGSVWMGGDRAGADDAGRISRRGEPKVFHRGAYLIGYTTSFRMGQVLEHGLIIPVEERARKRRTTESEDLGYLVMDFVDAVRTCLKKAGVSAIENEVEEGCDFLLGYRGRLYRVFEDYQVATYLDGYEAIGGGADLARGALFATGGRPPSERILLALKAAEHHHGNVRGPFDILCLGA